jgi:hypothetical protein
MPLQTTCPHCGTKLSFPEEKAGQIGKCPKCSGNVLAPHAPGFDLSELEWQDSNPRGKDEGTMRLVVDREWSPFQWGFCVSIGVLVASVIWIPVAFIVAFLISVIAGRH